MIAKGVTEPKFNDNALAILQRRYLLDGETPADMLRRASLGNDDYYEAMASFDLLPNSPTLFNAGTNKGTLSACFKFDIEDSLVVDDNGSGQWPGPNTIMGVAAKAAAVQQFGGGVGYVLSAMRPRGAEIHTTNGVSSGPVQFLDLYNTLANVLTQGGKRHGAQMAIMHCDHADIAEFIHCKDDINEILGMAAAARARGNEQLAKRLENACLSTFNISVAATDEFMVTNKRQVEIERSSLDVGAQPSFLWQMAESAWKTGDPGCYFIDAAERGNPTPWAGPLSGTNPCGEVPLRNDEPCNLLSLNLSHFVKPRIANIGAPFDAAYDVDWDKLEHTTRLAIRFMDDILDANMFPHPNIDHAARYTRKLGLGGMGWADALALMHIHYDSDEAVSLADMMWRQVNRWAAEESLRLGALKGPAPAFIDGRDRGLYDGPMYRNTTRTCWAPTGTISQLVGASSGCEPHFALTWMRTMNDAKTGEKVKLPERIPVAEQCAPFVPHTSMEIDWRWHIKHQAAFQRHTDLAVSKTINMPRSATVQDIYDAYVFAHETGCKGVTVYRDGSRDVQVLTAPEQEPESAPEPLDEYADVGSGIVIQRPDELSKGLLASNGFMPRDGGNVIVPLASLFGMGTPTRRRLPDERPAIIHKFRIGDQEGYIQVGCYDDGQPGELFVTVSKEGSTLRGLLETVGILTSLCLQYGVPLEDLCRKMQGISFEPDGMTGNPQIPSATSIIDYIFHWMLHRFKPETAEHHQPAKANVLGAGLTFPIELGLEPRRFATNGHTPHEVRGDVCPDCGSLAVHQEGCLMCSAGCGWSRC